MLILAVLLALLLGWCTGGRLAHFVNLKLHLLFLPPLALLLQAVPGWFPAKSYDAWGCILIPCSYLLLFIFLWTNRHLKKTTFCLSVGSLCNIFVISFNSWRMPVSQAAASVLSPEGFAALTDRQIPMYALADKGTSLGFLGDILYCPIPLFKGFASIGDLLLAAGVFFCLMAIMCPSKLPRWMRSG